MGYSLDLQLRMGTSIWGKMPHMLMAADTKKTITSSDKKQWRGLLQGGAGTLCRSKHYFLTMRPGIFALIGVAPNCYFDQSIAPSFTLTNGMSVTDDPFFDRRGNEFYLRQSL